jgi:hypothetical protein
VESSICSQCGVNRNDVFVLLWDLVRFLRTNMKYVQS